MQSIFLFSRYNILEFFNYTNYISPNFIDQFFQNSTPRSLFVFQFNRDLFFLIGALFFLRSRTTGIIRGYLAERSSRKRGVRSQKNRAAPIPRRREPHTLVYLLVGFAWDIVGRRPQPLTSRRGYDVYP